MSADPSFDRGALGDHYAGSHGHAGLVDAFWMPFTANRQFKAAPRLLASASGMHYRSVDGREILDATAGCGAATPGIRARASSTR
jgi:beta-alanine--pyruvate transaminase